MGCGPSSGVITPDNLVVDFFDDLAKIHPKAESGILPYFLETLEGNLLALPITEQERIATYLRTLSIRPDNFLLFDHAAKLILEAEGTINLSVINFFIGLMAKPYPDSEARATHLPPLLKGLEIRLLALPSDEARASAIDYFNALAARENGFVLFNIAAEIFNITHRLWPLREKTLAFLNTLYARNIERFNSLMATLKYMCEAKLLFLNAEFIDVVIESLMLRAELPTDLLGSLDTYLATIDPDIEAILRGIRLEKRPSLATTASLSHRSHHDLPHAMEIKNRTMHVCKQLNLLNSTSKRDRFLRNIIAFMIEFHDFIQSAKPPHNELTTAVEIMFWLKGALNLAEHPAIEKLLTFIANQIIVLGTTMIFGGRETTDLSELYLQIKEAALAAGCFPAGLPLTELGRIVEVITLIVGVCDKNPTAIREIANLQYSDSSTDSARIVRAHYSEHGVPSALVIERFFRGSTFLHYFSDEHYLNVQRFLIIIVPHMSMCGELCSEENRVHAHTYTNFINECRKKMRRLPDAAFKEWYATEFDRQEMATVITKLFLNNIASEAAFSRKQIGGLTFVKNKLTELLALMEPAILFEEDSFIKPSVPEIDARNLEALKLFYDDLAAEDKVTLIQELLLVVILQAGRSYAEQSLLDIRRVRPMSPTEMATLTLPPAGADVGGDVLMSELAPAAAALTLAPADADVEGDVFRSELTLPGAVPGTGGPRFFTAYSSNKGDTGGTRARYARLSVAVHMIPADPGDDSSDSELKIG